jgi:hypothetical protein
LALQVLVNKTPVFSKNCLISSKALVPLQLQCWEQSANTALQLHRACRVSWVVMSLAVLLKLLLAPVQLVLLLRSVPLLLVALLPCFLVLPRLQLL